MLDSLLYVIQGHLFWQSMGMTVATAMMIGAICHNGDFKSLHKTLIGLFPLVALLLFTSLSRLYPNISAGRVFLKTYASYWTVLLVSFAYFIGLLLGVKFYNMGSACFTPPT